MEIPTKKTNTVNVVTHAIARWSAAGVAAIILWIVWGIMTILTVVGVTKTNSITLWIMWVVALFFAFLMTVGSEKR